MKFPNLRKLLGNNVASTALQNAAPQMFQSMPGQQPAQQPGMMGFFQNNMPKNHKASLSQFGMPRQAPPPAQPNQALAQAPANALGQGGMRQAIFNSLQKKQNRGMAPGGMRGIGKKPGW